MKKAFLLMIHFYKQFISSRKGYSCAYRVHKGRASCSSFGCRAINRHGVWVGTALIQRRFKKCSLEHKKAGFNYFFYSIHGSHFSSRSGHCDIPAADCGGHHGCDSLFNGLDCCSGCDFDLGWFKRRREDNRTERVKR